MGPTVSGATFINTAVVFDLFPQLAERRNDARTSRWYMGCLQDFCGSYGRTEVGDPKPSKSPAGSGPTGT